MIGPQAELGNVKRAKDFSKFFKLSLSNRSSQSLVVN